MTKHVDEAETDGARARPADERRWGRPFGLSRLPLVGLSLVGAAHLLGEWVEFTRFGSDHLVLFTELLGLSLFVFSLILLAVPFWLLALVVLRAFGKLRTGIWDQVRTPLALAVLAVLFLVGGRRIRDAGLDALGRRARPVCDAIDAYARDRGEAPPDLESLVPDYLASVPPTGVGRSPEFGYLLGQEVQDLGPCEWVLFTEVGQLGYFLSFYRTSGEADGAEGPVESRYRPEYGLPL